MKILVAPDSFKGSLTAARFCEIAKQTIELRLKGTEVVTLPMADGGEGTMEALVSGTGGIVKTCFVTGPLGGPVLAQYGLLGDGTTAVVEMAESSGLPLVPEHKRNPLITTSYGTGELIRNALDCGAETIILGLGGSATNDGGAGALQALGFSFLDKSGNELGFGGGSLVDLTSVNVDKMDQRILKTHFKIASDVSNPLLGKNGATMTYGPQKGATETQLQKLEAALTVFAAVSAKVMGKNMVDVPGAGAAGGMGFGFLNFCGAKIESGFELIGSTYGLDEILEETDFSLIITGEGEVNFQSVQGKLVGRIAELGKRYSVPVVVLAGAVTGDVSALYQAGVVSMSSIVPGPTTLKEAMAEAELYLETKLVDLCELLKVNWRG